jgi:hypothetical protein
MTEFAGLKVEIGAQGEAFLVPSRSAGGGWESFQRELETILVYVSGGKSRSCFQPLINS